jgi:hypothetical protein
MDKDKLMQDLIACRKQELHGYAKAGKDYHDTFSSFIAIEDLYDTMLKKGIKPPFSKTTCIAMHRLYAGHPEWAEDAENVVISDLTKDEQQLLESVAIEGMRQFCEENGMDTGFLYDEDHLPFEP